MINLLISLLLLTNSSLSTASTIEKDESRILELLEEIIRDIKNYELEIRIEELESKFSKDLNENTFNEIKELKKLQKIN